MITKECGVRSIEPGETFEFTTELGKLFDLSKPDRYEVDLQKHDPTSHSTVQSNTSTFDNVSK